MRFVLSRRRARGFALIEMLGALAIAALLLAGIAAMMDSSLDDVRAQQAAQYQAQVTAAPRVRSSVTTTHGCSARTRRRPS